MGNKKSLIRSEETEQMFNIVSFLFFSIFSYSRPRCVNKFIFFHIGYGRNIEFETRNKHVLTLEFVSLL
jgi:hypothetical protein